MVDEGQAPIGGQLDCAGGIEHQCPLLVSLMIEMTEEFLSDAFGTFDPQNGQRDANEQHRESQKYFLNLVIQL